MRAQTVFAEAAVAMPPLLSLALRVGTRAAHDRIEANPRFARLMAPDLARDEYVALLARMHGHHAPAEAALASARHLLPEALRIERRLRRAPLLAADLTLLGLSREAVAALPLCPMPAIRAREQAWGLLYVLEGSALGGQLIARHVAGLLGLDATNGASGVVPHGAESGAMWRDFKELLDAAAQAGDLDQPAVVEAAN